MNTFQKTFFFFFITLIMTSGILPAKSQIEAPTNPKGTVDLNVDVLYDNLLNATPVPTEQPTPEIEKTVKDEIASLLPDLNNGLYNGWANIGEEIVWTTGSKLPDFISIPQDLITELECQKILKQTYKKEEHLAEVIIYKFKDPSAAYSIYTLAHVGDPSKLKLGKNVSESENQLSFWKSNFYISIRSVTEKDIAAKEFSVLCGQDISRNIAIEPLPPIVAIQLPALNRIFGSEKFCNGSICCESHLPKDFGFDYDLLNLPETSGVITADYQTAEEKKSKKEPSKLLLVRYKNKENAETVFKVLKEIFEKKKTENKDLTVEADNKESILKLKNKKTDFMFVKQKGNLLAISKNKENKKSTEQVIELVPWPVEITKPFNLEPENKKEEEKKTN